jgi:methylated-DNA-[protein]-cysteine S-methyltransferase
MTTPAAPTSPPAPALPAAAILYTTIDSPVGELLLTGDGTALTSLSVPGQRGGATILPGWRREPAAFTEAERQLGEYFAGDRRTFDLPLAPVGSAFRQRVWNALDDVPYGATISYRGLAEAAGSPGAVRAIGGAVGSNPLLLLRPCHRVIGADGSLTGYSGGLERKRTLLALEGVL